MIGDIGASQVGSAATPYKIVASSDSRSEQQVVATQSSSVAVKDRVTLDTPQEKKVTYSSPLTDQQRLDNQFLMLRALVANIFKSQGLTAPSAISGAASASGAAAGGEGTAAGVSTSDAATTGATNSDTAATTDAAPQGSSVIDVGGGKSADIATMTPEEAKKLVAEDGYWGVKQTSDRIFQQAVGISGNDPTNIDKVKEGILKGFGMARTALGGELPDISSQTLDAVMKKLDDWVKNPDQSSGGSQASPATA